MPNWVTNNLTIYGDVKKVRAMFDRAVADKDNEYTLESFVPMPRTFYETDTANGVFVTEQKFIKEYELKHGVKPEGIELDNIKAKALKKWNSAVNYQNKKYGVVGWYNWRCLNLGTKWDADLIDKTELHNRLDNDADVNGQVSLCLVFDTAWASPYEWLRKVVKDNPELVFEMWCDEESGYKFYYEGSDGELSEDLSNDLYEQYREEAKNTSVEDLIAISGQNEDSLMANMLRNPYAREYIINNMFGCGYWDRNGWADAMCDYVYNQLEYILDDFITTYLNVRTDNEFITVAKEHNVVLSDTKLNGILDDGMRKELINTFSYDEDAVYNACMSGEYEKSFVMWLSNYEPQVEDDETEDVG